MRKLLIASIVAVMVAATLKGAVAPPPSYYDIVPAEYGDTAEVSSNSVNEGVIVDRGNEGVSDSGMSVVAMLLSLLVIVSVSSAVIIYRLKVRS